ncbi:deazaflavin-dependent nitroreductase [Mycobacteroides immunogenum]|uniref:Deazaflavin-dependent nitroreductase n=1 Tax=Mycobacteroides immunogenum TaxID=83262 RepID=A0A179VJH7_9MYCO|nr:nitroreductase/quinone reductase family protein [Mycobacteroides immunogenum]OAT70456.1 deazaflavin-dependent nitroreductase [Mycobacteroides immunogenum]
MSVDIKSVPKWLKYFNKVVIGGHKVGLKLPMVVLTVPGAKSGQPRSTPITPFTLEGQRYAVGGVPGSAWIANARKAKEGTLTQGRHTEQVRIVELSAEDARPVLRAFPIEVPTGVGFIRNAGLVKEGTPDEFEALAGIAAVFRFDPVGS